MSSQTATDTGFGFVREDIGLAILGALAFVVGVALSSAMGGTDSPVAAVGAFFAVGGGILAVWRIAHLGYRLAFPKKN